MTYTFCQSSISTIFSKLANQNDARRYFYKDFATGCYHENSEGILRRLLNTFFKAYAKDLTDKIKSDKERETRRKKLKLSS